MAKWIIHINFTLASLQKCNAEDPSGSIAVFEGVNFRNANLEGANLNGMYLLTYITHKFLKQMLLEYFILYNIVSNDFSRCQFKGILIEICQCKKLWSPFCNSCWSWPWGEGFYFWTKFYKKKQGLILLLFMFQQCNLSGSDLNEANLRGSNLTNTVLESMLSPLHMSQTIR